MTTTSGDHGFGLRLRQAREGVGLSQERLAHFAGISEWWLRQIEAGRKEPRFSHLLALHAELSKRYPDFSLTWFVTGVHDRAHGGIVDDDLRRREFLAAFGAAAKLSLPMSLDLERLFAPTPLDGALLDGWARLVENHAALRPIQPPHELLPMIDSHLTTLRGRVAQRAGTDSLWRRLLSVTAAAAALAGWVAFMADGRDASGRYVELAEAYAREAGDHETLLVILMLRADLLSAIPSGGQGGLPRQARGQLERALSLTSPSTPMALRGPLLLRSAEELAYAGIEAEALGRLDEAAAMVSNVGPRTHHLRPAWEDPAIAVGAVNGFRGNCLQMLGRTAEAIQLLESISSDILRNDNVPNLIDRAAAHARQREPERACELLTEAADLASANGRTVGVRRAIGVRTRHLALWENEPFVRQLDERLAAIL